MKQLILPSLFVLTTLILSSCSDFFDSTIELEIPDHVPELAITCNIAEGDTAVNVFVTKSKGALDLTPPNYTALDPLFQTGYYDTVPNVTAVILRNNEPWLTLPKFSGGWHRSEVPAITNDGATYALQVTADGFSSVTATAALPTSVPITDAIYEPQTGGGGGGGPFGDGDKMTIKFNDPIGKNYYRVYATVIDINGNVIETYLFSNNDQFDGNLLSDETFEGKAMVLDMGIYIPVFGEELSSITVYLESISKELFLFESAIQKNSDAQGNPFAEPVIIRGNIEGGFGNFGTSSKSAKTIEL